MRSRYHTPFFRSHAHVNNYNQQTNFTNEHSRQAMLKSTFKTPYKNKDEPIVSRIVTPTDLTSCQTKTPHRSSCSVPVSVKLNVGVESETHTDRKVALQTEQESKADVVKADTPTLTTEVSSNLC